MAGFLVKQFCMTGFVVLVLSLVFISASAADGKNQASGSSTMAVPITPVGTGFFDFRCNIEGATVYLDDNAIGAITNGTLIVSIPVYDRSYKRQLRIEAPGYTMYNETLLTGPKPGETMVVRGILQVLPFNLTGTLSLAVSPPGSEVSIDGAVAGVVPESGILKLRTVNYGNRNISVTKGGYQVYTGDVYIEPNMETKLRISLAPRTTGTLQITSNPSGAQVSINKAPYGSTPVTVPDLEQGTYIIDYSLQGYQSIEQQVILTASQTIPVSGLLEPMPTPTPTLATPIPSPTPEPTQTGIPIGIVIVGLLGAVFLNSKK